jgi:hypothetical protein
MTSAFYLLNLHYASKASPPTHETYPLTGMLYGNIPVKKATNAIGKYASNVAFQDKGFYSFFIHNLDEIRR